MRQERRQFRHPDILPYAYEIPCQVTPSKGLIRQADRYKPMVFPIVIFIRDIGYIGIRHILFTELPDQVVVQVSSYSHRITIIINQRYTETIDRSEDFSRDYLDLFPNLSVTYAFDPIKRWMLVGQYARNIERPPFYTLNPNRIQSSDYSYQIGNPYLRPTIFSLYLKVYPYSSFGIQLPLEVNPSYKE